MGAHSTMKITAADARKRLVMMVMDADDTLLERMMDKAFYDRLYNFRIVYNYDDELPEALTFKNRPF